MRPPTSDATTPMKLDMTMMYAFHDALRHDLESVAQMTARSDGWDVFQRFLRIHHTVEDEALWPVLREELVDRPRDLALLDQMEAEHAALEPLLDAIDDALDRGESAPAARTDLAARLGEHLRHEEEAALPLIDRTLSEEQWMHFGEAGMASLRPDMPTFLPWLLSGTNDERTSGVLGYLPAPVQASLRDDWQPAYAATDWWAA